MNQIPTSPHLQDDIRTDIAYLRRELKELSDVVHSLSGAVIALKQAIEDQDGEGWKHGRGDKL